MTLTPDPASPHNAAATTALREVASVLVPALLARQDQALVIREMPGGRCVMVNAAMLALLRRPETEVLGETDQHWFDATQAAALRAADQTALAQAAPLLSEHRLQREGARVDLQVLRVAGAPDAEGRRWLVSVWTDQASEQLRDSQLRAALEQLEQLQRANETLRREVADQALRDPASGLHTRPHFEEQLKREVDMSMREQREFALVFIAVDALSERAQSLGAAAQARILDTMGRLLRGGTRAMDASCRLDGGRFAVLLSGVGLATAHARIEGLRRQCAAQIVLLEGVELAFTVSVGVASFPHTSNTQDDLLAACASALDEAQRRGGNHVTLAAIRFENSGT